jgi:hypothetical protein
MSAYAGAWPMAAPHRRGFSSWFVGGLFLLLLMFLSSLFSQLQQPSPVSCSPPQCRIPPPHHGPLTAPSVYTSSRYGFSLSYLTGHISPSKITASSIAWDGSLSDGSEVSWSFTGMAANGQSAQQIVTSTQSSNFPDAQPSYTLPDASIGYTMGYGNVYDVTMSPGDGQSVHDRLLVIAAIQHGVAVVMVGLGPYRQSTPQDDPHPDPAATPLVELGDFDENITSVTWRGEPPL